jgi:hemoglobin
LILLNDLSFLKKVNLYKPYFSCLNHYKENISHLKETEVEILLPLMKKDIENREDLLLLVQEFYVKLLKDSSISYLFTDVAKINLDHHLPVLVDFWDMVLFDNPSYKKNAMEPHMVLNAQSPLTKDHFSTWLTYFKNTVDELFKGDKAFMAKERATSIATIMQIKIAQLKKHIPA